MLRCTVKFCGGCNPRYERGDAYKAICAALQDTASFSYPEDGVPYDVLLILRGCTAAARISMRRSRPRTVLLLPQRMRFRRR